MQSTSQPNSRRSVRAGFRALIVGALLLGIFFLAWFHRQYIADSISYWQYQPTAAIQQISARTDLTDAGQFTFYAAQPTLASGAAYNSVCNQHEENTAILGCYTGNRIYLYDVTDERLNGIKEVTAAHEMLHAVYQRLSESERSRIDQLLDVEYQKLRVEPNYAERMAYYARTEPGQKYNELHSIVGTEVEAIAPELETHYARYFKNRSTIVSFHKDYNGAFTELENKRTQLSTQLDALSGDIERLSREYAAAARTLSSDISEFNSRAESGEFDSQTQFNRERQQLVERSNNLASQRNKINELIKSFNTLKDEYNSTVMESNELYKSMDSSLTPAPRI